MTLKTNFGRINTRKEKIEVFKMMLYSESKTVKMVEDDPSLIFVLIKEGYFELIDKILSKKIVDINTKDNVGNDVICRLLKAKKYDLVLKYMKKSSWNVNNQNQDGNTFAHILATINYKDVVKIIKELRKNKGFLPNIKNNKNETILEKSINDHYIYTTLKILEDKRFNSIDILVFKKIYITYIKSSTYGKYSKLTNLEAIMNILTKKDNLKPSIAKLLENITNNMELVKKDINKNKTTNLDTIINSYILKEA